MSTILVIDDHPLKRKVLHDLLGSRGHDIAEAKDGETGLEMVQQRDYDLLFLDLILPQMSGIQFLQALCELPMTKPPRVILNSSLYPAGELESIGRLCGIPHVLAMPDPPHLKDILTLVDTALATPQEDAPEEPREDAKAILDEMGKHIKALQRLHAILPAKSP